MNIQLTFDTWDELCVFLSAAKAQTLPENGKELVKLANESKKAAEKTDVFKAAKIAAKALAEEPKEEPDSVPFDTAETATEPEYALTDAQKAVRECVKAKGKDAAKAVLANFKDKSDASKPAGGASALRPEDYAAAIKALREAANA